MPLALKIDPNSYFARLTRLKKLFWLYFLLLIFEGALRKWIVPQLSAPLLIIRDPVAILIIWEAYRTRKWPARWSVPISLLTVLLVGLFALQIVVGDNQFLVGLYGLRSYLLPFPVIFIMGENLNGEDLQKLGACTLWLALPMCLLALGQYMTPESSFLNKGAYTGAEQISYIGSRVRSSGTFSFAIGLVEFSTLAAAFVFYGMVRNDLAKGWLIWASTFALILIVPTTGQRALVIQLGAVVICVVLSALMGVSQFVRVLRVLVPLSILLLLVSLLPVFNNALQSMTKRFSGADASEGGTFQRTFYMRTLSPIVESVEAAGSTENWLGIGLGQGALAVQAFLTGAPRGVTGEYEISHELMEMGPFAGSIFELFKVFLLIRIFGQALAMAREGEPLALLLFPLVSVMLCYALLEQPTLQGFTVIATAFCIAATRVPILVEYKKILPILQQQRLIIHRRARRS
jgi:hypothetical protein